MSDNFEYTGTFAKVASRASRYKGHRIIDADGVLSQETWDPPAVPVNIKDRYHRVYPPTKFRLDRIADYYYGNQKLWWYIALANNIVDPFMELNDTDTPVFLRIPAWDTVVNKVMR